MQPVHLIFVSYFPKDRTAAGGVTALANDVYCNQTDQFDVVALHKSDDKKIKYIHEKLNHSRLNTFSEKFTFWLKSIFYVWQFLISTRYETILSCTIVSSFVATFVSPRKLTIWENVDYFKSRRKINIFRIGLALLLGAKVIFTSRAEYELSLKIFFKNCHDRIEFVPNWTPDLTNSSANNEIVGAGFLEKRKGFDLFLENMPEGSAVALTIYGEGPEKEYLKEIILKRKLKNVKLSGYSKNIYSIIESCKAFILPSRFEGSPLVLLHALKAGKRVALSNAVSDAVYFKKQFPYLVSLLDLSDENLLKKQIEQFLIEVNLKEPVKASSNFQQGSCEKIIEIVQSLRKH